MRRASTVYSKRWPLACEQALLLLQESFSKQLRFADDDKVTVWKKKAHKLLCEKSLRPESHENKAKVLGGPQRSQFFSEKKLFNVLRIRAGCEANVGT